MDKQSFNNLDDYIAAFPVDVQVVLNNIRDIIKNNAPQAEEVINYNIPTFKLNGNLVHFAAFKNHIGFYPTPSVMQAFSKELSAYKQGRGSVQFPLKDPIPYILVENIVKFRVKEVMGNK